MNNTDFPDSKFNESENKKTINSIRCWFHILDVTEMSKNLASESKRYKWDAKKLSLMVSEQFQCVTIMNIWNICIFHQTNSWHSYDPNDPKIVRVITA